MKFEYCFRYIYNFETVTLQKAELMPMDILALSVRGFLQTVKTDIFVHVYADFAVCVSLNKRENLNLLIYNQTSLFYAILSRFCFKCVQAFH